MKSKMLTASFVLTREFAGMADEYKLCQSPQIEHNTNTHTSIQRPESDHLQPTLYIMLYLFIGKSIQKKTDIQRITLIRLH